MEDAELTFASLTAHAQRTSVKHPGWQDWDFHLVELEVIDFTVCPGCGDAAEGSEAAKKGKNFRWCSHSLRAYMYRREV